MRILIAVIAAAMGSTMLAQTTIAPTTESVGEVRGATVGPYNVVNEFETGYRFDTVGGQIDRYRSDVNFGSGVRVLSTRLGMYSKQGTARWFDELVITTQGLGSDPYESASLRIQRNKLYRYDLNWRLDRYYNPALTIANGLHRMDTERRMQDHDLTLFPQSHARLFLGYSRNAQDGPALSTVQLFDNRGDEFPLMTDVRRMRNEYRLGGDVTFAGMRLTLMRGWESFKEDTTYLQDQANVGANPADNTTLTSFRRGEPYHGTSPYWRANISTESRGWFAVTGRVAYTSGRRAFLFDESALGTDRFAAALNRQILVAGTGSRPATVGNLTLSLFPTSRLTVTNHTSFQNTRMNGNAGWGVLDNATLSFTLIDFQLLDIRTISNTTEVNYRATKWLGLVSGYHFASRRIESRQATQLGGSSGALAGTQTNQLHAGMAGLRLQPLKPLIVTLDGEVGRADNPFLPVSERNYHALGARVQFKQKTLLLSVAARSNYNNNSVSPALYSSRSRNYSADASWAPVAWFSFDAGYSKQHLDTISGLAYFAASQLVDKDLSLYISNIHAGNAAVRFGILKRVDLFAGYSLVKDTGDGRLTATGADTGVSLPAFAAAQTFPLRYVSPFGRISVRLNSKLRWNAGYQHYGYHEEFFARQNYRAHTGYVSLLWAF
ncbi:MAG: hypothetical protein LLG20_23655 [Acidobacteriales bacterium]|nr:hypothetical protein [Terriglobales bacterium]